MSQTLGIADGRCIASGRSVRPFIIEPLMTVLCPECGADVPVQPFELDSSTGYQIIAHQPRIAEGGRRWRGTQLMFEL